MPKASKFSPLRLGNTVKNTGKASAASRFGSSLNKVGSLDHRGNPPGACRLPSVLRQQP